MPLKGPTQRNMQSTPAARKESYRGLRSISTPSSERQDDRKEAARPKSGVGQRGKSVNETQRLQDDRKEAARPKSGVGQRGKSVNETQRLQDDRKEAARPKSGVGQRGKSVNETQRLQDDRKEAARPKSGVGQRGKSVNETQRLLADGGNKRPKSDASRSSTAAEGGILHLQGEKEMLRRIRNNLREACERNKAGTPLRSRDSKTSEEYLSDIDSYADILIKHLDSKSDKSIKEKEQTDKKQEGKLTEEAKQTIARIKSLLSKLGEQIDKNEFDIRDFKASTNSKGKLDDKGTKKIIEDICTKLKNRKENMITETDREGKQLETAIEQLENEIKTMKRNGKTANKKLVGQRDSLSRINDCTESVKTERTAALSEVKTIYDPLWKWRSKLSEGKKAQLKTNPTNMSEETDIMAVLKEISILQSELFMVIRQDEKELMLELKELDKDIQNDRKDSLDMNQADKMVDGSRKSLRMIRLQLMQKQKQLKNTAQKEKDEDSATSKKLQKLKEQIRKMWGKVMKENEPPDISEALLTLENHITENKAELEKLIGRKERYKQELDQLHADLKRVDGRVTDATIKTDTKGDNVMQAILLVRKELNKRIKEIKEDIQNGTTDQKEFRTKLHQSVAKLWKTAVNDEEKVTNDVRDDGEEGKVLQKIEAVTTLFDRLETIAFKLEKTCYGIYDKVKGAEPVVEDTEDVKTSIHILETTLKNFEEAKTEIVEFAANFDQLVNVLSLKREKSISGTCKLMTETIERYREKYKKLRQEFEDTKERESILKTEKEDLLLRLSKVASANLTDNNPNIADLSDQNRPTKLAEQFSELYDNPWTNAFEELKHLDDRKRITFLLEILVETYKCCKEISINHQKILMRALQIPTDCMEKPQKNARDLKLPPVLSKALSELKKQTADLSVDDVTRYLTTNYKKWFKTKQVGAYASECIKLCWLMNVHSPPVCMITNVKEGSKFDTDRFKYYTKTGKKLDYMVWPVLLLHEGGPLLCKGVAQGK